MFEHNLSKHEFTSAALPFNLSFLGTMLETLIALPNLLLSQQWILQFLLDVSSLYVSYHTIT